MGELLAYERFVALCFARRDVDVDASAGVAQAANDHQTHLHVLLLRLRPTVVRIDRELTNGELERQLLILGGAIGVDATGFEMARPNADDASRYIVALEALHTEREEDMLRIFDGA